MKAGKVVGGFLAVAVAVAGCVPTAAPTAGATARLLAMPPATFTPPAATTEPATAAVTPVIIASPTATATPVTHVVAAGETMLGIAIDFGVSLTALEAANPTVEARFLSIGTVLVIPSPEGGFAVAATNLAPPPPASVTLSQPVCYPTLSGSLYCLVEARNPTDKPVADVSARIVLAGLDGLPFASQTAFGALDIVLPGGAVPLAALFQPASAQAVAAAGVELETAIVVATPLTATVPVVLNVSALPGAAVGGRWTVAGSVHNPATQPLLSAWVVLSIYDSHSRLTGFRKVALENGIGAGETRAFSISADALGAPAEQSVVVAEGRP